MFGPAVKKFELENFENNANFSSNAENFNFEDQNFVKQSTTSANTTKTFQQTDRVRNKNFCRASFSKTTKILVKSIKKASNSAIWTQFDKNEALGVSSQAFQEAQKICYRAWQQIPLLPRWLFAFPQYKLKFYQSLSFVTYKPEQRNPIDPSVIGTKLVFETTPDP